MSYFSRLKELRIAMKLNQADMGRSIGIPQTTYSNYENGAREIPIALIETIVTQFGVNAGWLIAGEVSKTAAQKLHRARRNAGYSLDDAAKHLSTTVEFILGIEDGRIAPSQDFLAKMCGLYKHNMYEVLDETINNVPVHTSTGDAKIDYLLVKHRAVLELLEKTPEAEGYIIDYLKGLVAHKGMKNLLTGEKPDGKA